jgi:glycogen(starch) synthase
MVAKSLSLQDIQVAIFIAGDSDACISFSRNVTIVVVACSDVSDFRNLVSAAVVKRHSQNPFDVIESCDGDGQGYAVAKALPTVPFITRSHTPMRMIHYYNQPLTYMSSRINHYRLLLLSKVRRFAVHRYRYDLEYLQLAHSGVISCSSLLLAKSLPLFFPVRAPLTVVPYAYDCSNVMVQKSTTEHIRFGFAGSIDNRKGVSDLLRAIDHLIRLGRKFKFVFVGKMCLSETTHEYFEYLIKTYPDVVSYLGHINYKDIPMVLQNIDVLVLPSWFDSYGYVCIEAVLNGCGLVCSQNVGASELLVAFDPECIHKPYSYKSLVRSLLHTIEQYTANSEEYYKRLRDMQFITLSKHSLETVGGLHVDLLNRVAACPTSL